MSGDGGGDGDGGDDTGASFDDPEPDTPSYDPDTFSGLGVTDAESMDPHGYEGKSGFTASGAPGMGPAETGPPSPEGQSPIAAAQSKAIEEDKQFYAVVKEGRIAAQKADPTLSQGAAWGMSKDELDAKASPVESFLGGTLGYAASQMADAVGRAGLSVEDPSFADDEGGWDAPGPPPEPVVTPLPEIVSTGEAEPPLTDMGKTPATDTGVTAAPAAEEPAGPTVSPKPASAAPGTLLRRRRRTRTILTSPQGVVGPAVPARRTRSLPRKTLLGG
tara:strand:- start:1891 stop:2715 length:825 start_codon:yes stop_codon:yes gene_type:complete